ncbi:hypothetical protein BU17DRAFT_62264 [Hysterangium stoloniferum]|nr:hypothetical protein BU17DRAFT_62264 [Hysterangium stoloniferum]
MDVDVRLPKPRTFQAKPATSRSASSITRHNGQHNNQMKTSNTQEAFDILLSTNPIEFERRENEGLNALDGRLREPPIYATPIIIQCAILGAPHQSLTLSELRVTLKIRFQYYDVADVTVVKSWERTLLRTLSDHTRFQCSKRMGPSGASWTINHSAPPIKCIPKRQCHIRKRKICPADQPNHLANTTVDNDTTESDGTASTVGRSPSISADTGYGQVRSLFPVRPASASHGGYIELPPLPSSRQEWCPTSPRLWSRSEISFQEF